MITEQRSGDYFNAKARVVQWGRAGVFLGKLNKAALLIAFAALPVLLLTTGCGSIDSILDNTPNIDTTTPFTANATIAAGEHSYDAQIVYKATGELSITYSPGPLSSSLTQTAQTGGSGASLGGLSLSYPSDWAGARSIAQLAHSALNSPGNTTRQGDVISMEGTAFAAPFVLRAKAGENILLSLSFPTLGIEIMLSDFVRETL